MVKISFNSFSRDFRYRLSQFHQIRTTALKFKYQVSSIAISKPKNWYFISVWFFLSLLKLQSIEVGQPCSSFERGARLPKMRVRKNSIKKTHYVVWLFKFKFIYKNIKSRAPPMCSPYSMGFFTRPTCAPLPNFKYIGCLLFFSLYSCLPHLEDSRFWRWVLLTVAS